MPPIPSVDALRRRLGCDSLVGRSAPFHRLLANVLEVARWRTAVLLTGETGTGKSKVASVLHEASGRRGPLVTVSCPALPDTLFERELFGSVRGAYTGSERDFEGLASQADGGTLFLEEVGDLSPRNQAKLLQFLDKGEYRRLGGTRTLRSDVRVVAATNRALDGVGFRSDLWHRLSEYPIRVPSLAERVEDVTLLAAHFVREWSHIHERRPLPLASDAAAVLVARSWPGNLRELRNVVTRGLMRAATDRALALAADHLDDSQGGVHVPQRWQQGTDAFHRVLIEWTLTATDGNRAAAARRLGISRSALYAHLDRLGIGELERFHGASILLRYGPQTARSTGSDTSAPRRSR